MKCMRCHKEAGSLQRFPSRDQIVLLVCDDCHAELALDAVERSRNERVANMMQRSFGAGFPSFDEACRS